MKTYEDDDPMVDKKPSLIDDLDREVDSLMKNIAVLEKELSPVLPVFDKNEPLESEDKPDRNHNLLTERIKDLIDVVHGVGIHIEDIRERINLPM